MKSCSEELYTIFCRTEQAECKRIFKQPRDFTVEEITFSMVIYVDINLLFFFGGGGSH